jgi:endonuclease I
MYSDKPNGNSPYTYFYGKGFECGNYSKEGDCFNREHSFPKSWFGDASPMYTDLFHLYPTDGYVNNRRANYPFGETKNATWTSKNSSEVGPSSWPGYSGIVFEPIEEYKGDFARTMFYMATRYYGEDVAWPGSDMVTGAEPKQWAREMLLFWHNNDSVSTKERNRNNEVFKFQNNRNPFIDDPQFAERIWGLPNIMNETISEKNNIRLFPNPARESVCLSSESEIEPETNITICNISGRIVLQIKMNARVQTLHINKLIPGIYFVRIENLYFTKIIKLIRL